MIISLANVKCHGSYGVFDGGCQGLITAAMLDRIQGLGVVWNLFLKGTPQKYLLQLNAQCFKNNDNSSFILGK